jgi:hypothetical protein
LYFKTGFSPKDKNEYEIYGKVLDFKNFIEKENRVIFKEYSNMDKFENLIRKDLNVYLNQEYRFNKVIEEKTTLEKSLSMPDNKKSHHVFISYNNDGKEGTDSKTTKLICNTLEYEGIKCWITPRDIEPGKDWATAITKTINKAPLTSNAK